MHASGFNQNTGASAVIPYYIAGSVAFFIAAVLVLFSSDVFFGHYFQPRLLAITHLMALGWGTMMIFGALFQFLPVLLEVRLYSEKLSKACFFLMVTGIPLLVYAFWKFETGWPLQVSSVIITAGVLIFALNVYKTASATTEWGISADFITTSVAWLVLTVIVGTLLAFNFRFLFLPKNQLEYLALHAHLGIVGWFVLLIIGVSSRLVPMFLLSPKTDAKFLSVSYYLVNLGLVGFITNSLLWRNTLFTILSAIAIFSGLVVHVFFIRSCYMKRVRKILDVGMKQSLIAFLLLVVPLVLLVTLTLLQASEQVLLPFYIAYGFSIFFGFISTLILGQVYKTLPFIAWLAKKTQDPGTQLTPKDMFSAVLAKYQFLFHASAFILLVPAILLKIKILFIVGAAGLVISSLIFNINVFKILTHLLFKKEK